MDLPLQPVQTSPKTNSLAVASFILGLATMFSPILAGYYLVTRSGGPGYLQSLFCGVPVAFAGLLTGIVALLQVRVTKQPGTWMAVVGMVFVVLFTGLFSVMLTGLLLPFLMGKGN